MSSYLDETAESFTAFCAGAEHRRVMQEMADLITWPASATAASC